MPGLTFENAMQTGGGRNGVRDGQIKFVCIQKNRASKPHALDDQAQAGGPVHAFRKLPHMTNEGDRSRATKSTTTSPATDMHVVDRRTEPESRSRSEIDDESGEAVDTVAIGIALDGLFGLGSHRGVGRNHRRGALRMRGIEIGIME